MIINEIEKIVSQRIPEDLWDFPEPKGWVSRCIYKNLDVNLHSVSVKLGNCMEKIFMDIARLEYPSKYFPRVIAGYGVTDEEVQEYRTDKFDNNKPSDRSNAVAIYTRLNQSVLMEKIANEFVNAEENNICYTHDLFAEVAERITKATPMQPVMWKSHTDICAWINSEWNIMEVKLGGNLDKTKTKVVLTDSILCPYIALGSKPKKAYYGIISNDKGNDRQGKWKGQLSKFLSPEMILMEECLFKHLTTSTISFAEFQSIIIKRINYLR